MNSLAIYFVCLCVLSAGCLLAGCRMMRKQERKRMSRLRETEMYQSLYQSMLHLKDCAVDQVIVEATGVTLTSVCPAHIMLQYGFKQNGNACRNAEVARHVALTLGEDFPILADPSRYRLTRYRIFRLNGRKEYGYLYAIRHACKKQILEYYAQYRPII